MLVIFWLLVVNHPRLGEPTLTNASSYIDYVSCEVLVYAAMRLFLALWRFYVSDDRRLPGNMSLSVLQWFQNDYMLQPKFTSSNQLSLQCQQIINILTPSTQALLQRTAMDVAKFFLDGWRPPVSTWRVAFWKMGDFCPFADEQTEFPTDGTGKALQNSGASILLLSDLAILVLVASHCRFLWLEIIMHGRWHTDTAARDILCPLATPKMFDFSWISFGTIHVMYWYVIYVCMFILFCIIIYKIIYGQIHLCMKLYEYT